MKKSFSSFLVLISAALMCYGCSSDDPSIDANLFGTWTLTRTVFSECTDASLNQTIEEICTDRVCEQFIFNEDNTFTKIVISAGQEQTTPGTFIVIGNEIQLLPTAGGGEISAFIVTATTLTLNNDILACQQSLIYSKQ